jgi:IclR family transcriptional regulator, acetate operon repressor
VSTLMSAEPAPARSPEPPSGPIGRAMLVLDCITRRPAPVRLSEIARQTGLAKSTVHRLLGELESHDAVRQAPAGYVLGEAIKRLSQGFEPRRHDTLRRLLIPHLADLHGRTRLVVGLAVLEGATAVFVETIYPRRFADLAVRAPERVAARQTAAGRLLLAQAAPGSGHAAAGPCRAVPGAAPGGQQQARAGGGAVRSEEHLPGLVAVAAPVGRSTLADAAISLAGPPGELDPVRCLPLLRQAAHEASMTLRRYPGRP